MAKQDHYSKRTRAFTLLELSVVLVIIGLLAGILTGMRSYIVNSRLTTMMNETKFYIDAFNQFQTHYNAPPGDYSNAVATWSNSFNGDGNGIIRAGAIQKPAEYYYAFQHLALGGFIEGNYTGQPNALGGATVSANVPLAIMENISYLYDHPDQADGSVSGDPLYFDGIYGNVLRVAALKGAYTTIPNLPFLTGKQAYQLDNKFDDGQPGVGTILTPKASALAGCASNDTTAATYVTTTDAPVCYFFIKIQ